MIEIPEYIKKSRCRWEWWYVPDKNIPRKFNKVYVDKKLNKEITKEEYNRNREAISI